MLLNLRQKFNRHVRPRLPPWVMVDYYIWRSRYDRVRINRHVTKLLGPQFRRSVSLIEIDITYACNLSCNNCNRSIEQAPTSDHMSVEQIVKFVDESKAKGLQWERIRLLGGEPTLHKDFFAILDILREYKRQFSPDTRIEVATNGYGKKVAQVLSKIPDDVVILNTQKTNTVQPSFAPFNIAPKDVGRHRSSDFRNGCKIIEVCGLGLGPSGYYPCAVAGAIDRVFGWDIGRQTLPDASDAMEDLLEKCCQHCGHFDRGLHPPLFEKLQSKSWKEAYARYQEAKVKLSRYGETAPSDRGRHH